MDRHEHWEQVYRNRPTDRLGWYKPHLQVPLAWIAKLALAPEDAIIDVGGGASTLVDDLLEAGHCALTVLDVSEAALAAARERLGTRAAAVNWLTGDITSLVLPASQYALWHDRAVYHFLTDAGERRSYRRNLHAALGADGHAIIASFAPEAPAKCSGLPVRRYDEQSLAAEFAPQLQLVEHLRELHVTPGGVEQMYVWGLFVRDGTG